MNPSPETHWEGPPGPGSEPSAVLRRVAEGWQPPADGPRFTLAETIDQEAMGYRAWVTPYGDFLSRQMETLAQMVRWTGAETPEEHEARMEVWEDEIRQQWEARGYEEGRRICRCGRCMID